jgi:hypothetical protein
MSSIFSQLFAAVGFPVLTQFHGEPVTYTPPSGEPVTFSAPFAEMPADSFDRQGHREKVPRKAVLEAPAAINGTPQTYDVDGTFTVGSDEWRVGGFGDRHEALITIHLHIGGDIQFAGVK